MAKGKAPSQRQLRVGEELRHALAEVFERDSLRDPDLKGRSITVTEVRASPDLKNVTVYVMPLGGENVDDVVVALRRASSYLRGEVARRLRLRNTPRLSFEADRSFDQASHIDKLLRDPRVSQDIERDPPATQPQDTNGTGDHGASS
jgi:ribosome-binding factor A